MARKGCVEISILQLPYQWPRHECNVMAPFSCLKMKELEHIITCISQIFFAFPDVDVER